MSPRAPGFLRRWLGAAEWSSERVARYYDEWHERYMAAFGDTFQSQRTTDIGELFTHIADQAELAPGMRVLDAGCGIAGPALWLARHREVSVAALNISGVQVAEARARVDAAGIGESRRRHPGRLSSPRRALPAGVVRCHPLPRVARALGPSAGGPRIGPSRAQARGRALRQGPLPARPDSGPTRTRPRPQSRRQRQSLLLPERQSPDATSSPRCAAAGFALEWLREPPLPTQHDLGNAFVAANAIDIYEGPPVTFLDWLELKARKPA